MQFQLVKLTTKEIPFFYDIRFSVEENLLLSHHSQYLQRRMLENDINQGGGWIAMYKESYVGVGFGVFTPEPLIGGLFVKPEYQLKGIGTAILHKIEGWFLASGTKTINLTTDQNSKAEFFYKRNGWIYDGLDDYGQNKYIKSLKGG